MIATDAAPFEPRPDELRAMAVSLNSPVVGLTPLPTGPATAAIAVHESGRAALVIRSQRTGDLVWVAAAGPEPERAFQRALASAEGLGFLFEEEAYAPGEGLEPGAWPTWLREAFAEPAEGAAPHANVSRWLSKFRWVWPQTAR